MRASSGLYVSRLDHVRALAALLVYCWHFVHVHVPYAHVPAFPLFSLLEEGHIGVGLFMTLSGYLFAKIIDGRDLNLPQFYRNRLLRLIPLLALALAYWALRGQLTLEAFFAGFVLPAWSGGAWSVAVELHFYALFPVILVLQRHHRIWPLLALLTVSISVRAAVWQATGSVQAFSYWTIGGALDMFLLGMLWHELSKRDMIRRSAGALLLASGGAILAGVQLFNAAGGFYGLGGYPSPSLAWILIPTVQGLAFGALIVGYEHLKITIPRLIDRAIAKTGEVSYSIYLMHFIFYPTFVRLCHDAGFEMAAFEVSLALAFATFPLMVAISIVTYTLIERPFLRLRGTYGRQVPPGSASAPAHIVLAGNPDPGPTRAA